MIGKLLETITGKDDLERVAYKEDLGRLNEYLKTRKVLIPKRPLRFLDAGSLTQEQLLEQIRKDAEDFNNTPFEPWIMEVEGKKRLPAFSSVKKAEVFSSVMAKKLNKVFSVACGEVLLSVIARDMDVDFVDLNLFSEKSWEIGVKQTTAP